MSWLLWNFEVVSTDSLIKVVSLLPVISAFHLLISRFSEQGGLYRYMSGVSLLIATAQLTLGSTTVLEPVMALVLGAAVCAIGYMQHWRVPLVTGAVSMVAGVIAILAQALVNIEVGTWIGLAIGGVVLVILGSLLERYGDAFYNRAKRSWQALGAWS